MPTVSVKLSDATRESLAQMAQSRGVTPHALMVDAIEGSIAQAQVQDSFIRKALQAREQLAQTGQVMEPDAFGQYLKAKVNGKPRRRPQAQDLGKVLRSGS